MELLIFTKCQKPKQQNLAFFKRMCSSQMQTIFMCSFMTRKHDRIRRRSVREKILWATKRLNLKEFWVSGALVLEWDSNKFRNSNRDQLFWHRGHFLLLLRLRQSFKLSSSRSLRILMWSRLIKYTSRSCLRVRAVSSSTLLSKTKITLKWWTSLERLLPRLRRMYLEEC
jgi:hypothetical protein